MDSLYGRAVALAAPIFIALLVLEVILDRVRGTRSTASPTRSIA